MKEGERKKKEAAAPPKPIAPKKTNAEADEKELNPNVSTRSQFCPILPMLIGTKQYFEIRSRTINKLRQSKNPNPYPHKFSVNCDLRDFVKKYESMKSGEHAKDVEVRVGGRIYNKRASRGKLVFYDIRSEGVKVQVMCQAQEAKEGCPPFEEQHEYLRRGDIIGIVGYPGRTAPRNKIEKGEEGELSIFATEVILLTPCLHQLPDEYYGFKDQEQRHRKRYLDLIMNEHTRKVFVTRSKMITGIRKFFDRDFVEVETPMMNSIASVLRQSPLLLTITT
jgi:lysyl-tRNA synthetase, class II